MDRVVLLVDDEPIVLSILSSGLQQAGYRVVAAQTAADALHRAKQLGRIDVLASDVILPDHVRLAKDYRQQPVMHGIALMRKLITLQPDLRVVLFSGQPEETIQSLGGIPEGTAYLRKPFSSEALVRRIKQVLEEPRVPRRRR